MTSLFILTLRLLFTLASSYCSSLLPHYLHLCVLFTNAPSFSSKHKVHTHYIHSFLCSSLYILPKYALILHLPPVVDCESLPHPTNGFVAFSSTIFNSVATYGCQQGYQLEGETQRTCLASSQWSGAQPSCSSKQKLQ